MKRSIANYCSAAVMAALTFVLSIWQSVRSIWFPLGLAAVMLASCEARRESAESPFEDDDCECILAFELDLSGSCFESTLGSDGRGYKQFCTVKDVFFRNRTGINGDRILISQISGRDKALLWDGRPANFAKDFPTSESFSRFLRSRSDPAGSPINTATADVLDYLVEQHERYPNLKSTFVCISDLLENYPDANETKKRLAESLKAYGRKNGCVAIYGADQSVMPEWKVMLRDSGLKYWRIEPDFRIDAALPTLFE